jgi:hypothetical protein
MAIKQPPAVEVAWQVNRSPLGPDETLELLQRQDRMTMDVSAEVDVRFDDADITHQGDATARSFRSHPSGSN